jgi:hypothetical protein
VPLTLSPRPVAGPGRRGLLTAVLGWGAAAGLLAGCSDDGPGGSPRAARRPGADPAARALRERSARDSRALLARYDATASAHPGLAGRLAPLRAEVAAHAAALDAPGGADSAQPSASAQPPGADSAPPSGAASPVRLSPTVPDVPQDAGKALSALADAERRTADARTTALLDAPPELARLLASVAASGAVHAYLLTERR